VSGAVFTGKRQMNDAIKTVAITLIKSGIGRPPNHRETLKRLGLTRLHKTVLLKGTPQVRGMVNQVSHLVSVIEQD
jgi:large subunit ribosomal protein L30